jgi:hypothetical protein
MEVVSVSALRTSRLYPPGNTVDTYSFRDWDDTTTRERPGGISGIETATFRFVAQCLNQLFYRLPYMKQGLANHNTLSSLRCMNWNRMLYTVLHLSSTWYNVLTRDIFKFTPDYGTSVHSVRRYAKARRTVTFTDSDAVNGCYKLKTRGKHTLCWRSWIRAPWYNYENNQQDALYRLIYYSKSVLHV